jgi:hypothetical protein
MISATRDQGPLIHPCDCGSTPWLIKFISPSPNACTEPRLSTFLVSLEPTSASGDLRYDARMFRQFYAPILEPLAPAYA